MTVRFRRNSLIPVLVFSIASGLVLVGLVGAETMHGQQRASLETSDQSKSANARLTSLGAVTNYSTQAAAEDKSYHGSVGPYLPLNILWRIQTGGGDRTITADPTERDTYPLEGNIFYVPMQEHRALGTVPLYRLFNGNDHMVSLDPHEGAAQGYHVEGILGYPFVSQQPGTSELIRTYNPSTGHHSLRNSTGLDNEQGYVDQRLGVFGYPRYDNRGISLLSLKGGGITVESNEVSGGALWHWTWNGVQVINNWDYGRQIQTDIFPFDYANPTEAGDTWSNDRRPAVNHGSPLGLAENDGLTQRTRSVTLEYDPDELSSTITSYRWDRVRASAADRIIQLCGLT